jgi:hypothetical protein
MRSLPDSIVGNNESTGLNQVMLFCVGPTGSDGLLSSSGASIAQVTAGIASRGLSTMVSDVAPFANDDRRPLYDIVNCLSSLVLGVQGLFPSL